MSTADNQSWLTEAGEYVLGTLRGPERELFEKVLQHDASARALVDYWEHHFQALRPELLGDSGGARLPMPVLPAHVWSNISARIDREPSGEIIDPGPDALAVNQTHTHAPAELHPRAAVQAAATRSPAGATRVATDTYKLPERIRRRRWQMVSAFAIAASLLMGLLLLQIHQRAGGLGPLLAGRDPGAPTSEPAATARLLETPATATTPPFDELRTVATYDVLSILSNEAGDELWAVLASTATGQVRAIALQPPTADTAQSHQLWVVLPEDQGVQAVGLLPYGSGSVGEFDIGAGLNTPDSATTNTPESSANNNNETGATPGLTNQQEAGTALSALQQGVAFAISLEPAGGSPEPVPTGPVISSKEYLRLESGI